MTISRLQLEEKHGSLQRSEFAFRELKFEGDEGEGARTFSGYGAVFNNTDSYGDVIEKGAFKKTIREAKKTGNWPAMLMQHGGWAISADDLTPVGIYIEMDEDDQGLLVKGKLATSQRAQEALDLLKMEPRPALNGLSIGYRAKKFTVGTKPEEPRRLLHEIELVEISLVTFPANPKARIGSVKSGNGLTIRDAERSLRDAGFSANEAKAICAKGFTGIDHREGDDQAERLQDATQRTLAALKLG